MQSRITRNVWPLLVVYGTLVITPASAQRLPTLDEFVSTVLNGHLEIQKQYENFEAPIREFANSIGINDERIHYATILRQRSILGLTQARDYVKQPWIILRFENNTDQAVTLTVEYIPLDDNEWKTARYDFAPNEKAILDARTNNRNVTFNAKSATRSWELDRNCGDSLYTICTTTVK